MRQTSPRYKVFRTRGEGTLAINLDNLGMRTPDSPEPATAPGGQDTDGRQAGRDADELTPLGHYCIGAHAGTGPHKGQLGRRKLLLIKLRSGSDLVRP